MDRASERLHEDLETTYVIREKPVLVPRCPLQIPRGLALN